jgi:proteasome lid subunit RPN8/RPN11
MLTHIIESIPEEACGLLAGKQISILKSMIEAVLPVTNQLHSSVRFYMDPIELIKAFDWMDTRELELLGIYHSHPVGPERPSPTDLAEYAYPGVAYLIWCPGEQDWQVHAYDIDAGEPFEISLEVIG